MSGFLIRRAFHAVLVVFGVTVVTFILIHLEPGSTAKSVLGVHATPAAIAYFNKVHGLGRPLPLEFWDYLTGLAHGHLGHSYADDRDVTTLIAEALPKDAVLLIISNAVSLVAGVAIGIYQALRRNRAGDFVAQTAAFVLYAMPFFLLGFILIDIFAITLKWLPPGAPQYTNVADILAHPAGLVLPVLTLALGSVASYTQFMRSEMIDNLVQDYVRTARAKGLSNRAVVLHHLLRNSLLPIVTILGLVLPGILSGAIVVETVFNYPGMGLMFFNAALKHDYPVLMGFTLFGGVAVVVGNFLADVAYAALDPRVRLS
ncbi:MAG TPA: ABC transporter permease [Nocardioidaceae bacterium]|nr:ABC transporter permease [Nocardioidaceae bacterium]